MSIPSCDQLQSVDSGPLHGGYCIVHLMARWRAAQSGVDTAGALRRLGNGRTPAGCGGCVTMTSQLTGNRLLSIDAAAEQSRYGASCRRRPCRLGRYWMSLRQLAADVGLTRSTAISLVDLISLPASPVPHNLPSLIPSPPVLRTSFASVTPYSYQFCPRYFTQCNAIYNYSDLSCHAMSLRHRFATVGCIYETESPNALCLAWRGADCPPTSQFMDSLMLSIKESTASSYHKTTYYW